MNGSNPFPTLLVVASAGILLIISLISCLILMIVTNLGAHGPSIAEFLTEFWQLPAAVALTGLALYAAVKDRAVLGMLAVMLAAFALITVWWLILR